MFNVVVCLSRGPPIGSSTTFKYGGQEYILDASKLENLCILGQGAHGLVRKMRHGPSKAIMAVKVSNMFTYDPCNCVANKFWIFEF